MRNFRAALLATAVLIALLFVSIVFFWVDWAAGFVQAGICLVAIAYLIIGERCRLAASAPVLLIVLTLACWGFVQLTTGSTVNRYQTWLAALNWVAGIAGLLMVALTCVRAKLRRAVLLAMMGFALTIAVLCILQAATRSTKIFWIFQGEYEDALGPFANRDHFSAFLELLLPVAVYQAARSGKVYYAGAAAGMLGAIVASGSRAGVLIGFGETALTFFLAVRSRRVPRRQVWLTAGATALLAALVIFVAGPQVFLTRIRDRNLLYARVTMMRSGAAMLADRPWTGFGLGTFENVYPAYAITDFGPTVNHAHNDWIEWGSEAGLPFVALLLCGAAWAVYQAIRSIWGLGVLAIFVHAIIDFPLHKPPLLLWTLVMIGLLAARRTGQDLRSSRAMVE